MSLLQAVVLAVLQGVTEFLPISSSAHLVLLPWLTGWPDQGLAFDVALHFGTLLALLAYFYRDWIEIIRSGFLVLWHPAEAVNSSYDPRLLWYLALATIPVGAAGVLLEETVATTFRNPYLIASMLIGVGILMAIADTRSRQVKELKDLGVKEALIVGSAQALALVPGTSRSGITITAALFCGTTRKAAAEFSFLLSTPALGGAALKTAYDLWKAGGVPPGMGLPIVVGIVTSALTGWLVIAGFLRFLRTYSLKIFVWYRIVFGIIILALATIFGVQ